MHRQSNQINASGKRNGNTVLINGYLEDMFMARHFYSVYHTNKITVKHINRSKFH